MWVGVWEIGEHRVARKRLVHVSWYVGVFADQVERETQTEHAMNSK